MSLKLAKNPEAPTSNPMSMRAMVGTTILVTVVTTVVSQVMIDVYKAIKNRKDEERKKNAAAAAAGQGPFEGYGQFMNPSSPASIPPNYQYASTVANANRSYGYNFGSPEQPPVVDLSRRASELDARERHLIAREREMRLVS
jgi:hypothetical protein